eukprot:GILK01009380.1.p1 GENE.GILK01009380.1~~GILK01009380.1.p1  ORF type:complete len:343 (-),score=37.49 GILK01009380.1:35-1063(-)
MSQQIVCVTGATGFLAGHCIALLLDSGYKVHGTVRSLREEHKYEHLLKLPGAEGNLHLFEAELNREGSFNAAFQRCTAVFHVASPVMLASKNAQADIIDPAVNGVKNVLRSCVDQSVKSVIMTSSIAAVTPRGDPAKEFNEEDWSTSCAGPYDESKTLAERAAWDFWNAMPEANRFHFACINPVMIIGPLLSPSSASSVEVFVRALKGRVPMVPGFTWGYVDVRDVAKAHLLAMHLPAANGQRFIVSEATRPMLELFRVAKQQFPLYPFPRRRCPNLLVYVGALFDKEVPFGFVRSYLDKPVRCSNEKSIHVLGVHYRDFHESVRDTVQSIFDLGIVPQRDN